MQGVLRDGSKIVVFASSFELEAGRDTDQCVIALSVNSVRKAFSFSPLGFVHPPALTRGLSVKSVCLGELN